MSDTATTLPDAASPAAVSPRFVTGSLLRHVVVMASTGAVGLVAVFFVDLINLFYISMLGQQPVAAAVGFAGVVAFFQISFCIGVMIAIVAVVSRAIGAGRAEEAKRLATASLVLMAVSCVLVATATFVFLEQILDLLGATGETRRQALGYLQITQLAMPFLGTGMACAGLMRAVGDARRSMSVTLTGAVVAAILDPILIFGLQLDLKGAAIASVMARMAMTGVGLYGCTRIHQMLGRFDSARFVADARRIGKVAGPSILANLATPFGAAFITHFMAQFGTAAVAGLATIDRLVPVAFGLLYALSGAVGPIIGQNFGAQRIDRVRQTLIESLRFMAVAVCAAWLLLALGQQLIIYAFSAKGLSAELISLFCSVLAGSFFFLGALFVANAAFNNLGYPLYSTGFNWARATLGTIPFAYVGSHYGAAGVLIGPAIGGVIFGSLAMFTAFRITRRLATSDSATSTTGHRRSR